MATEPLQSLSKSLLRRKLSFSLVSVCLYIAGMMLFFKDADLVSKLIYSAIGALVLSHIERIPRFIKSISSENIEVFTSRLTVSKINQPTTLPFQVPGILILVFLIIYLFTAILEFDLAKVFIGLSMLVSALNNLPTYVIFDYSHQLFYGLWSPDNSFYMSDKQPMHGVTFLEEETVKGIRLKVTDKSGYYYVSKKKFSDQAWERILVNTEKINQINGRE